MATMQADGFAGWAIAALRRTRGKVEERDLRLVETLSLGGRKQVSLVVCAGQKFLVGCGPDNVTSIVAVREEAAAPKGGRWEAGC